tara:strand:+ start:2212 stop:3333 length:1122 start_codon:yes stop_codon:yes gene_type:complete
MYKKPIVSKALNKEFLTAEEGLYLYHNLPTSELMWVANEIKKDLHPSNKITWQIDRNVNTTNACIANCKFCNFFRVPKHKDVYITDLNTYKKKIEETIKYGGDQLLLQGGHHPDLGLDFYVNLFKTLKENYPKIKLHALGPPEIAHICKIGNYSHEFVLEKLSNAGMDSMPGAGAEILSDRVRRLISKGKCTGQEWLDIMQAAHKLNITTSATMMFGHVETTEERFDHLIRIREVQEKKPKNNNGFLAFIAWPFMDDGTLLQKVKGINNTCTQDEYLKIIAISRIMLPNIRNIQTSWLTVGPETAQLTLHGGANDMGSIMLEENVVSAAGAPHRFTSNSIQKCIKDAGFVPQLRTQLYKDRVIPKMVEQKINY